MDWQIANELYGAWHLNDLKDFGTFLLQTFNEQGVRPLLI